MTWVLRRKSDGKFVAKAGRAHSYTRFLSVAETFKTREEAVANSCPKNEFPEEIDIYEVLK